MSAKPIIIRTPYEWAVLFLMAVILGGGWIFLSKEDVTPSTGSITLTEAPIVGQLAPDFTLQTPLGETVVLSEIVDRAGAQGQPVVLNFWASWCGPCIQTMPLVEEVVDEIGADRVHLVAVNIQETAARAQVAVERLEMSATVLLDSECQTAAAYAANAIPQTVIIDREGKVTHLFVGGGPKFVAQLREALQSLLQE